MTRQPLSPDVGEGAGFPPFHHPLPSSGIQQFSKCCPFFLLSTAHLEARLLPVLTWSFQQPRLFPESLNPPTSCFLSLGNTALGSEDSPETVPIHFPHSRSSCVSSPLRGRRGPHRRLDSKPWWALRADSPHRLALCLHLPTSPHPAWSESVTLRLSMCSAFS